MAFTIKNNGVNALPFTVKNVKDISKSDLFDISSVKAGISLSSYAYNDSSQIDDYITIVQNFVQKYYDEFNLTDASSFALGKAYNDLINEFDITSYDFGKTLNDSSNNSTDVLNYDLSKLLNDSSQASDYFFKSLHIVRSLYDAVIVSENTSIFSNEVYNDPAYSVDLIGVLDGVTYGLGKTLNDSSNNSTDVLNYDLSKLFYDTVDSSFDRIFHVFNKNIADNSLSTEQYLFSFEKVLNDSETPSDFVNLHTIKYFTDSIGVSDDVSSLYSVGRRPLDSSSASDLINTIGFGKNLNDSSIATSLINKFEVNKPLTDSINIIELLAQLVSKPFVDSSTISELATIEVDKPLTDSITSPTDLINTIGFGKNVNDPIVSLEALVYDASKPLSNILSPIEYLTRDGSKVLVDTVSSIELSQLYLTKPAFAADSAVATDAGIVSVQNYFAEAYVIDLQPYVERIGTTF